MNIDLKKMAAFGVAGNFTGHLEQAGEALDFTNVRTKEAKAPKALFPTYITSESSKVPSFLKVFPFSPDVIKFPKGEEKIQIEPECGIIFDIKYADGLVKELKPVCFGASNDCSIRKEGCRKISEKKNWGPCSKGFAEDVIALDSFDEKSFINDYKISSFMLRDGVLNEYGEDSFIRDYNYVYGILTEWIIDRLNNQKDEGPAEDLGSYLKECDGIRQIFVSIGATRYTDYGEHNFLHDGDEAIVVLYPSVKFTTDEIKEMIMSGTSDKSVSILRQKVIQ